ncbi:hypothetical protein PGT21_018592 [Puccinia graminis f. sp. tritici]|uniref:Uncharacterized protein n=1 Tax=Puccinia graminis f. sp. tritici TaxID=56615 RepID=A0A5B0LYF4_PUCGR|nr:hypothetical protein PGTUg99_050230 [Puccinia graminis f. sp. tritici]KAA1104304.1 hypothetical protein PGT21_018592 [Puccinia graminis f. sp. tritici]
MDSPQQRQLRLQYEELHSNHSHNDEQSFARLLRESSVSKIKEYLDGLAEAYSRVEIYPPRVRNAKWLRFLLRYPGGRPDLVETYDLQEGSHLDQKFIKLAFFHQHPRWAQQEEDLSHQRMLAALLADSIAAGEDLLAAAVIDPQHAEIIKAGYRHPYLRDQTISQPILKRLDKAAGNWSQTDHLAPFTSLIGPSMIGKTRLLQQLSKSICVVYICLRPHGSSGMPPRSKLADAMILVQKKVPELELEYTRLLAAIFRVVAEFFSSQPAQDGETKRLTSWFKFNDKSGDEFASRVGERLKEISKIPTDASASLVTNLKKLHNSTRFICNPRLKVLLAIDEARTLVGLETSDELRISYFQIFRRVLATIPSSLGFFAIFTDTTSTVADFNLTLHNDPSARPPPGRKPKELFAPIYDIGTFDSKVPTCPPKTWAELISPRRLFSYGVPFFRIYVEGAERKGIPMPTIVMNLREIAIEKLLCLPCHPQDLSEGQIFALLGSTIQPQIYEAAKLNSELVSSHLAHCLYISPSRKRIISEYPSQFALSMAANEFLANKEHRLISCIKGLTVILQQGLISTGNAGELASRIILLCAMHKAMSISTGQADLPYGCSVRLADFLCVLTGLKKEELDLGDIGAQHKKRLLNKGHIFWNHVVQITYTPNSADFLEFMYRGLAIQCKPNQPAFDQLFTIYLKSGPTNSVLDKDNISFCGVQAKNGKVDFKNEVLKWTDEYAGIKINPQNPYLVILFSFKTKYTNQEVPVIPKRGSLIFHGLAEIDCLTVGISNALKELLAVEADVRSFYKDAQMKSFVETIRPAVYPIRHPNCDLSEDLHSRDIDSDTVCMVEGADSEMND